MANRKSDGTIDPSKLIPPKTSTTTKPKQFTNDFVFNPLGNIIIDSSTSCNLEDAVAKMLGWLQGPIRLHPDEINLQKITLGQMPYLPKLYYTIEEHLEILHENAADNLEAIDKDPDASDEMKSKAINAFLDCEDLIKKAVAYKAAINSELAKEKKSELKIDSQQANTRDETFITLESLNDWAKENFDISVHDSIPVFKNKSQKTIQQPQRTDYLREEIIEILNTMQNPRPAKVMAALKARIGAPGTCIVGDIGYGIKWSDDRGEHEFDMKALRQRLRTLKKL